jgi:hypothetical protein
VAPSVPYAPRLSEASIEGLESLAKYMDNQSAEPEKEPEEEPEELEEDDGRLEVGELPEEYRSVFYTNTPWDNAKVRASIESRCTDLDFEDLILTGRVKQVVPVNPERLEVEYQSMTSADSLWIAQASTRHIDQFEAQVWAGYAKLVISLVRVNSLVFPDHLKKGKLDQKSFDEKYEAIMRLPDRITQTLLVNLAWFEDRISRLFVNDFEQLKNG